MPDVPDREPTVTTSSFQVDVDGDAVTATRYRTGAATAPQPTVLLCTGFGGTQDTPAVVAAAQRFATAGMTAVTFDYRTFGVSSGQPRQVVSVKRQLHDIRTVLRRLRLDPALDADRIALWGTSLGGGHVLAVAASEPVAAVVAQMPFNGFPRRVEGRSLAGSFAVLGAAFRDAARGALGRPPLYIPAVGAVGELAVMVGDEAGDAVAGLASATWRNEVAPRGILEMMRYRPGRLVSRIEAPLLVTVADRDAETVGETTRHLADEAPDGRLLGYDTTHFGIYRPDMRERVLADQAQFLRERLGIRTA
ncbi:alpha/beta hydrolase [Pseudactinotalea suaedae]|uniref:alpha/beta hydrolase n=1 Tax=Pseudactinotalea suaedae TaxID=1524924 RepID=UPI0012E27D62|nr:alpha/beta hydrolase [Pseudactinotalea suaedae]